MLDLNRSFAVGSDSCRQFHQVSAAHNRSFIVFKFFRWFSPIFASHIKITTFEFFKPLETLYFAKSMFTASFDKHSMRFCSSFLQVITKNQCCPQIVVRRHKTRHVDACSKYTGISILGCCLLKIFLSC